MRRPQCIQLNSMKCVGFYYATLRITDNVAAFLLLPWPKSIEIDAMQRSIGLSLWNRLKWSKKCPNTTNQFVYRTDTPWMDELSIFESADEIRTFRFLQECFVGYITYVCMLRNMLDRHKVTSYHETFAEALWPYNNWHEIYENQRKPSGYVCVCEWPSLTIYHWIVFIQSDDLDELKTLVARVLTESTKL